MMQLKLFTDKFPSGRCIILAKKLEAISTLPSKDNLYMAMELFSNAHKEANPAIAPLKDGADVSELLKVCHEFGVKAMVVK